MIPKCLELLVTAKIKIKVTSASSWTFLKWQPQLTFGITMLFDHALRSAGAQDSGHTGSHIAPARSLCF